MKGKIWTFWIFLAGTFLTARETHTACMRRNFKEHITDWLFIDHWFQVKIFTPTGQEVTVEHEFLSFIHTVCSSLIINLQFYSTNPIQTDNRGKVVWTYKHMLKELVNCKENEIVQFCDSHTCTVFYDTSFINITQFEKLYRNVCDWKGTIPECPSPHAEQLNSTQSAEHDLRQNRDALTSQEGSSSLVVPVLVIIIIIVSILFFISVGFHLHKYLHKPQNHNQTSHDQEIILTNKLLQKENSSQAPVEGVETRVNCAV